MQPRAGAAFCMSDSVVGLPVPVGQMDSPSCAVFGDSRDSRFIRAAFRSRRDGWFIRFPGFRAQGDQGDAGKIAFK